MNDLGADQTDVALGHAWDWFALHAGQRMQLISFFLAAIGFSVAGYGTALSSGHRAAAAAIALLVVAFSFAFLRLDRRTADLVHAAEETLSLIQDRIASSAALPSIRLVVRAETQRRLHSYSAIVQFLTITTASAGVSGAVYAVVS